MTAAGHFRYSDLSEKDAELKRLTMRSETIRMRDSLGAANAESALSALAICPAVLDDCAGHVYQEDAVTINGWTLPPPDPGQRAGGFHRLVHGGVPALL